MSRYTQTDLQEGTDLAWHLYEEAVRAIQSWAVVDPFASGSSRDHLRRSTQFRDCGLGQAHAHIVDACLRDTLLTLSRMTDNPTKNPLSLFKIPDLFQNPKILVALEQAWRWDCDNEMEQQIVAKHLKFLNSRVPCFDKKITAKTWRESEEQLKGRADLMKWRAELQRFRNATIVHASDKTHLGGLHLHRIRHMLMLAVLAARSAMIVFQGRDWDPIAVFRQCAQDQIDLKRSLSIDYIDRNASPLAKKMWEMQAPLR